MASTAAYQQKAQQYYSQVRHDVVPYLARIQPRRLLDVGCGTGNTLCYLKSAGLVQWAAGVDFMAISGSEQQNPLIDQFVVADLQHMQLPFELGEFDALLCADVLEHLINPWEVLAWLRTFLKPGGRLVVSLPNIREWRALRSIVWQGTFRYAASGVLDKTHLRFFCRQNMIELVEGAGFSIQSVQPSFATCPLQRRRKWLNRCTAGLLEPLLAQQYILVATAL